MDRIPLTYYPKENTMSTYEELFNHATNLSIDVDRAIAEASIYAEKEKLSEAAERYNRAAEKANALAEILLTLEDHHGRG